MLVAEGDQSFPSEARLKKRREFLRVQGRGRRVFGRRLIFNLLPSRSGRSRLGVTVSRKVGNAVVRNRIKRWLREVFRKHQDVLTRPVDLVVTAKRGVEDFSYEAIRAEFLDVLTRTLQDPDAGLEARRSGGRGRRRGKSGGRGRRGRGRSRSGDGGRQDG